MLISVCMYICVCIYTCTHDAFLLHIDVLSFNCQTYILCEGQGHVVGPLQCLPEERFALLQLHVLFLRLREEAISLCRENVDQQPIRR